MITLIYVQYIYTIHLYNPFASTKAFPIVSLDVVLFHDVNKVHKDFNQIHLLSLLYFYSCLRCVAG